MPIFLRRLVCVCVESLVAIFRHSINFRRREVPARPADSLPVDALMKRIAAYGSPWKASASSRWRRAAKEARAWAPASNGAAVVLCNARYRVWHEAQRIYGRRRATKVKQKGDGEAWKMGKSMVRKSRLRSRIFHGNPSLNGSKSAFSALPVPVYKHIKEPKRRMTVPAGAGEPKRFGDVEVCRRKRSAFLGKSQGSASGM